MPKIVMFLVLISFIISCSQTEKGADPAEEACSLLDQGKIQEAIKVLDEALEENPEDMALISIKSTAYAMKAGVDIPNIIIKSFDRKNENKLFFNVVIESIQINDDSYDNIKYANVLLEDVIKNEPIKSDRLKYIIYQISEISLLLNKFDYNKDNYLDYEEIKDIKIEEVKSILDGLYKIVVEGYKTASDEKQNYLINKIEEINNKIKEAKENSDDKEKFIEYMNGHKH